jgi:hypothetical protein
MLKEKASWSKPNIPNLIGRKRVDQSIFDFGTTIPIEFHEDFQMANNNQYIKRGEREKVTLLIDEKEFDAYLYNKDRNTPSDTLQIVYNSDLKKFFTEIFHTSYTYIQEQKSKQNKMIVVPDHLAEYIEFYSTGKPFVYRLKLVTNNSNTKLDISETLDYVYRYIQSKGFTYERNDIINFFLSLKTKPFVILSGISGTGKTKMIQWFAESLGATEENGRFTLIPVRPDWSDGSDLLGYTDIKGEFVKGPLTEVLINASENEHLPYFVVLDEMNLARVEYYFSDLLSVMESRKWKDGKIVTSSVLSPKRLGQPLPIPPNVYFIGTVNMDETTYPFSKKVLDRANTIEFNDVFLDRFHFVKENEILEIPTITNDILKSDYLHLVDCYEENKDIVHQVTEELIKINAIIEEIGAQIGYRVRDEICFYMIYNKRENLLSFEHALDFQIHQKILPRIAGNNPRTRRVLTDLYKYCTNQTYREDEVVEISYMRFPKSAKKVQTMLRRLDEDGFTSFWL